MAFKMKGNPMKRNFGLGSPMKQDKDDYIAPADSTYTDRMNVYEQKKAKHLSDRAYFKRFMKGMLKPGEKWEDDPDREKYLNWKFSKEYGAIEPKEDDVYHKWSGSWMRSK